MLALGMCVAGRFDGNEYETLDPDTQSFYAELAPISDQFDSEALAVAKLDRERLLEEGLAPSEAMRKAMAWIEGVSNGGRAVMCAYPASFDWLFFYWYQQRFAAAQEALGFSSCIDMKTMFAIKAGRPLSNAGRDDLPAELRSRRPHSHNALDDAKEQAEIFSKLFTWQFQPEGG